jgi:hypothetical protein
LKVVKEIQAGGGIKAAPAFGQRDGTLAPQTGVYFQEPDTGVGLVGGKGCHHEPNMKDMYIK